METRKSVLERMFILAVLAAGVPAFANEPPDPSIPASASLDNLIERLENRGRQDRVNAERLARAAGLPVRRELPNGSVFEIRRFSPGRPPLYLITNNVGAADTISTDELWPGGATGIDIDGTGMTIGEWDGGAVYADHSDFTGRVAQVDGVTTVSNHATHVAGTLIGSGTGLIPDARGMASGAFLDAYDWNLDDAEMATAGAAGLLVSNHSYGVAAGWLYIGDPAPNAWWWIGGSDPTDVEDPNFGYYDSLSQTWDEIAVNAPYYLIVKSAGNDGSDIGPAPGESYTVIDQDGDPLFTSTIERNPDCTPLGYDCLPLHSVAKNILTVGAVDDVPEGYNPITGPQSVVLAEFSSRGPTDDGRIKPDLVANGVFLMSTWSDFPYYAASAGTSMASPSVAGSLLLLQQHHEVLNGVDQFLRAATLKALAIHTADEAGDHPGPDYWFGWGLMNTQSAARVISEEGSGHVLIEGSLADGETNVQVFSVSDPDAHLVATLVWADPPATPVAFSLDPPDLMLVNDLDLRVVRNATTHMPWALDPSNPAAAATKGDNIRDNVEQVVVTGGGSGEYTVRVSHKGGLLDGAAQTYSLIISEREPPPERGPTILFEGFENGLPEGWSITNAGGVSWEIRTPVAEDLRYDNLTGGAGKFAMVDNNASSESYTGLASPVLDLTDATTAILRFRSYFQFDTLETINVETSTDGGTTWQNAWSFSGFNPYATPYVLNLTDALAGEANARFRFWWDSEGAIQGDLWQVDDVALEAAGLTPDLSAMCSGDTVDVQDMTLTGPIDCSVTNSIALHNGTVVATGAVVTVSAPETILGADFSVETGATLRVDTP